MFVLDDLVDIIVIVNRADNTNRSDDFDLDARLGDSYKRPAYNL